MKNLIKLAGMIAILAAPCYGDSVNTANKNVESAFVSALGDAKTAKSVAHSVCSYTDTVLSSAEVDALNATPIALVPAPGTGKTLLPCGAVAWINYGGTAWAGSAETIPVKYGTAGSTALTFSEAFIEKTSDTFEYQNPTTGVLPVENAALYATANADITTGNSPISIRMYYRTIGASLILE